MICYEDSGVTAGGHDDMIDQSVLSCLALRCALFFSACAAWHPLC